MRGVAGEPWRQLEVADPLAVQERLVDPVGGGVEARRPVRRSPSSNSWRSSQAGRSPGGRRSTLVGLDPVRRPVGRVEQPSFDHGRLRPVGRTEHRSTCAPATRPARASGAARTATARGRCGRSRSAPIARRRAGSRRRPAGATRRAATRTAGADRSVRPTTSPPRCSVRRVVGCAHDWPTVPQTFAPAPWACRVLTWRGAALG